MLVGLTVSRLVLRSGLTSKLSAGWSNKPAGTIPVLQNYQEHDTGHLIPEYVTLHQVKSKRDDWCPSQSMGTRAEPAGTIPALQNYLEHGTWYFYLVPTLLRGNHKANSPRLHGSTSSIVPGLRNYLEHGTWFMKPDYLTLDQANFKRFENKHPLLPRCRCRAGIIGGCNN